MDEQLVKYYNPEVEDTVKPKEGQPFISVGEAFEFNNSYANVAGFNTRMHSSKKKPRSNELTWKIFVCNKEGCRKKKRKSDNLNDIGVVVIEQERNRGETRGGCKVQLSIVKRQGATNWQVSKFVEEHNHVLATPRKVQYLRSHRNVSNTKKALSIQLSEANVPTSQQVRILEIQAGGIENIGCTERDLRNYNRDLREENVGDVGCVASHTTLKIALSLKMSLTNPVTKINLF